MKNNVYPSKPQFYYIKVGFKGSKLYRYVYAMDDQQERLRCLGSLLLLSAATTWDDKGCLNRVPKNKLTFTTPTSSLLTRSCG